MPSLPPLAGSSRVYIHAACNCRADQLRTSSLHHRCLGPAALLQLPLSAVPVYIVYPIVHTCYNLMHFCLCTLLQQLLHYYCTTTHLVHISWTSTRVPHLVNLSSCTSTHAPRAHLVHLYVCTSTRAPHLVHISSCTSARATHLVNLYACTAPREPHLVHILCISTRAPLRVHLISRAPRLGSTSCTHQAHPPSRGTWTIPLATVTFCPSALSISRS